MAYLNNNTTQALVGFWPTYSVVKVGKPFSDYELICEIQVKNGLDLGENYRTIINGCKTFAASIAQTLVDKQVKFQILSYKLGLGKSLTGLGLKKISTPDLMLKHMYVLRNKER